MSQADSSASGRRVVDDEDASLLKFGPDFQTAHCMLNAEVAIILEHKISAAHEQGIKPKDAFLKAYEYVNRVKQFSDKESVTRARQDLEKFHQLEDFEQAQLGNLCPEDAEEARTLIPSLNMPGRDIDTNGLTEALMALSDCKQFT